MDIKQECIEISNGKNYINLTDFLQIQIAKALDKFNDHNYRWTGKLQADRRNLELEYEFILPENSTIEDLDRYHQQIRSKIKKFSNKNNLKLKRLNKENIKEVDSKVVVKLEFTFN